MTILNRTLITLLTCVCVALLLFGASVSYQTFGTVRTNDLAVQLTQVLLLAGITVWLAIYGLWQIVGANRDRSDKHGTRKNVLPAIGAMLEANPITQTAHSDDIEPAWWFYLKMTIAVVFVAAVVWAFLTLRR